MQFLYDFFPVLLFFVTYKIYNIYVATYTAIIIVLLQNIIHFIKYKKFEKLQILVLFIIAISGGATILFHNPIFIKWKPTIVEFAFALIFFLSQFIGKKPIIRYMMESKISLPDSIWNKLNTSWVVFFSFLGLTNLYVVYNYSTDTWVNFKLFGIFGLTILFVVIQSIYLSKYLQK